MSADGERFTVVIADFDGKESGTFDVLQAWAAEGMLHDLLWVARGSTPGDLVDATLMTPQGCREVDLRRELALRPLGLVQAVSLHVLDRDEVEERPDDASLRRHLRAAAAQSHVPFRSGVLAVPAPGTIVPGTLFDASCTWNLVVEPEERRGDSVMSAPVTPKGLPGHAAGALAAIAGVWRFCSTGGLDDLPGSAIGNDPGVRVARAYSRILDGGDVVDDVIDGVLTPSLAWPPPSGLNPPAVVFRGSPERYVQKAVSEFLDGAGLRYVRPDPTPVTQKERLGFWAALVLFFTRFTDTLKGLPLGLQQEARLIKDNLGSAAVQAIYPEDSEILVGLDGVGEGTERDFEKLLDALRSTDLPGTEVEVADQRLWEDLRQVCFGMIDGGTFPGYVTPPGDGKTRWVLGQPSAVAPSPHIAPEFVALGLSVRCCDPRAARELQDRMRGRREGAGQAGSRLTSWLALRQSSFVWKLGEAIDDQITDATADLAAAWRIIAQGPPRSWDGTLPRFLRTAVCLACVLVAVLLLPLLLWRLGVEARWNVGVTLLAWVAWTLAASGLTSRHAFEEARLSFRFRTRHWAWHDARKTAVAAASVLTRQGVVYRQLVDWGEIIGGVLHAPWGEAPPRPKLAPVELGHRPLSVLLAQAEPQPDEVQARVAHNQKRLMSWGWMSTAYRRLAAATVDRYALLAGTSDPSIVNPDLDIQISDTVVGHHAVTGEPILNSRSDLCRAVRQHTHRDQLRDGPSAALRSRILEAAPDRLVGVVRASDTDITTEHDASGFLSAIAPNPSTTARFPRDLFAARSAHVAPAIQALTLPPSVRSDDHASSASITPGGRGERLVLGSSRVDVTDVMRLSEVVIIAPADAPEDGDGDDASSSFEGM